MNARLHTAALLLLLVACGGGGGDGPAPAPAPAPDGGLDDATVYSSQPDASLPGAVEAAATTQHSLQLGGQTVAYEASAGHLIAREPAGAQRAQAAVFYVDYRLPGRDPATRPLTFFYNGGPGSASLWLQLGSFGPKRLVTGVPETTAAQPFPLVDNADTLLASTDLVYVNAVGSGRSQAIAPFSNRSFWGVDRDAELFRDFITRYLQAKGRQRSPLFLYGESYGGPRSGVLVRRLVEAGVQVDGVVLQSPAMNYNSFCNGVDGPGLSPCHGFMPTYAAVAAWHRLSTPANPELGAWVEQARAFADQVYLPALQAFESSGQPQSAVWPQLAAFTGIPESGWAARFNLGATRFRQTLIPGHLIGRYDGRMRAPLDSPLAAEGDPSNTWLTSSFQAAINSHLRDGLRYRNASTYVMFSGAIDFWDFSHAGQPLPDTIPDLEAALQAQPRLRVLSVSGLHDLATPFHQTEGDLGRLSAQSRVRVRNYTGGHMSFLDDVTRPIQRADLEAFYAEVLAARQAPAAQRGILAATSRRGPDRAGTLQDPERTPLVREAAMQGQMRGPWVPPRH